MKTLKKDIEGLNTKPLYFFISKSSAILDDKIAGVKSRLKDKIDVSMDFKIFDALDLDKTEFADYVKTASFFSDKKFAVVKNAHRITKDISEMIASLAELEQKSPTVLILLSDKYKLSAKLGESVKKYGSTEEIKKPLTSDVRKWLLEKIEIDKLKMDKAAIDMLLENVDYDLSILAREYEKIYTFVISDKKKLITAKDISSLVNRNINYLMFDLIDFIGKKDKEKTLLCLKKIFLDNDSLIGAVTLLHRMFKSILYIKSGDSTAARDYILKTSKVRPEIVSLIYRKNSSYANNYSKGQVKKIFYILNDFNMSLRMASKDNMLSSVKYITDIIDVS